MIVPFHTTEGIFIDINQQDGWNTCRECKKYHSHNSEKEKCEDPQSSTSTIHSIRWGKVCEKIGRFAKWME